MVLIVSGFGQVGSRMFLYGNTLCDTTFYRYPHPEYVSLKTLWCIFISPSLSKTSKI